MKIEMYTKTVCPYCTLAKNLLKIKGFEDIIEYNAEIDSNKKEEMLKRAKGAKTFPQIFINDMLIGGYDDLKKLDDEGKLDKILGK